MKTLLCLRAPVTLKDIAGRQGQLSSKDLNRLLELDPVSSLSDDEPLKQAIVLAKELANRPQAQDNCDLRTPLALLLSMSGTMGSVGGLVAVAGQADQGNLPWGATTVLMLMLLALLIVSAGSLLKHTRDGLHDNLKVEVSDLQKGQRQRLEDLNDKLGGGDLTEETSAISHLHGLIKQTLGQWIEPESALTAVPPVREEMTPLLS